jgi:hypothetical protein
MTMPADAEAEQKVSVPVICGKQDKKKIRGQVEGSRLD